MPPSLAGEFMCQQTRHVITRTSLHVLETTVRETPGQAKRKAGWLMKRKRCEVPPALILVKPCISQMAPRPGMWRARPGVPSPLPPPHARTLLSDCADGRGKVTSFHFPVLPLPQSRINDGPWRETITQVSSPVPGVQWRR